MRTRLIGGLFISVFVVLSFNIKKSHAVTNAFCEPDKTTWEKLGNAFEALDIRKTVLGMLTSAMTDGLSNTIANRNPKQMMECSRYTLEQEKLEAEATGKTFTKQGMLNSITAECGDELLSVNCEDFTAQYENNSMVTYNVNGQQLKYNQTTTSGSLLGFANTVSGGVITEPTPVNLALFWNDSIKNVPFADAALAADVTYGGIPLVTSVLSLWKIARNMAFGILAVVMLTIGIMIMARKKISQQLVVTVQYALPRVILAVILIAFSYPIGAVLASSMGYLTNLIIGVLNESGSGGAISIGTGGGIGGIISVVLIGALAIAGVAGWTLIVVLVAIVVILILFIAVFVKAFFIHMKLIFSIILAPIIFALGAIPGNEAMTTNWFKKALAYVLSYVGLFVYLRAGWFILAELMITPATSFGAGTAGFFAVLLVPVLAIWILLQALKIPSKIEAFIIGDPKKPGGKR